jgi:hypothetical protein
VADIHGKSSTEPPDARLQACALGGGKFALEELVFSKAGWWEVNVHVDSAGGADTATFNLTL